MTDTKLLQLLPKGELEQARALAHRAAQHLTCVARANLPAEPDDSHSSLVWDSALGALCTQPMGKVRIGLNIERFALLILVDDEITDQLSLEQKSAGDVDTWLDERAASLGLKPGSTVTIPYELPAEVESIQTYTSAAHALGLASLAAWFGVSADALAAVRQQTSQFDPGASPVRCWPHHFDIATYIALEHGDPETARGIGAGMSPGDESNPLPYLYVNPWPHLDANALPPAAAPGHWHKEGYVGLVATSEELTSTADTAASIAAFLKESVAIALAAQGS